MTIIERLRNNARPATLHEAGHYIAALTLGFRADNIYVNVDMDGADGGSGLFPHTPLKTMDDVCDYCERRVQMLCAGVLAQYLSGDKVDEDGAFEALKKGTAINDWAKVRENVRIICAIRLSAGAEPSEQQLEDEALRLLNKGEDLVLAEHRSIQALADRLIQAILRPGRIELTRALVDQIPAIKTRFGA